MRQRFATAAVLLTLLAALPARGQVADGGVPAAPADGGTTATDAARADGGAPVEIVNVPESPAARANKVATMMLATPAPVEEPPPPLTRRLWFWMAITGVIAAGVLIGLAVRDPNRTRPECPPDYVCPL